MAADTGKISAAIFASGGGTNAANIMEYAADIPHDLRITRLVCDMPGAGVIEKAESRGVPVSVVPFERDGFDSVADAKRDHEARIMAALEDDRPDWIFLAGFMRILSPDFIARFGAGRIVNIHPSLLPDFPGRDGYGDAFAAGVDESGVTVHFVDEGVDTGPVIVQKRFPRKPGDTLETFRKRGMELEYKAYREAIDMILRGEAELPAPGAKRQGGAA